MWTFPEREKGKTKSERLPTRIEERKLEETLPTTIQGKPVQSKDEARVAVGLAVIGWRFVYQRAFYGGRTRPGGIVVDFLVLTPGPATPLLMQSRYWHVIRDRRAKDVYQLSRLRSIPNLANPIEIWDYQTTTIQATIRELIHLLGRG